METPKEILTELQEIAPDLGRSGIIGAPYRIPDGYFGDFTDILMNRIRLDAVGFSDSTSVEEIAEISSLLAGLQKKNPYHVPQGFFETLDVKIPVYESSPSKLAVIFSNDKEQKRRVISMPVRFIRYATAACIVGLIGIVTFDMTNHKPIDPIQGLANVSDQDMANYLDSDDIHWTPGIASPTETANTEFSGNDIHDLLSSVPDDELEQYSSALPDEKRSVN